MDKADREALDSAYQLARREFNSKIQAVVLEAHRVAATQAGKINPGIWLSKIASAVRDSGEAGVGSLMEAHLAAGDTDIEAITTRIRAFIAELAVPRNPAATTARALVEAPAAYEGAKTAVSSAVADRVKTALLGKRAKTIVWIESSTGRQTIESSS